MANATFTKKPICLRTGGRQQAAYGGSHCQSEHGRLSTPPYMDAIVQDVRYAFRTLRKAPTFKATIIGTLALAIAANATVFALVKAVLINPLPYGAPDRLVTIVEA